MVPDTAGTNPGSRRQQPTRRMALPRNGVSSQYVFSAQALILVTAENHRPALLLGSRVKISGQPSLTVSKRLLAPQPHLDQAFMSAGAGCRCRRPRALGVPRQTWPPPLTAFRRYANSMSGWVASSCFKAAKSLCLKGK
jgi:hypothetical protein